jgi:hypothetical protein
LQEPWQEGLKTKGGSNSRRLCEALFNLSRGYTEQQE